MLVYGPANKIVEFSKNNDFIVLGEVNAEMRKQRFWWMTIIVIIATIIIAALGIMPIMKSAMIGVVFLLMLKVITPKESYESINWQVIVLISALIPVGIVIQNTGTAEWIGAFIASIVEMVPRDLQPKVLLGLILYLTNY